MKQIFVLASLLLPAIVATGQEKRLNFYSSYVFDDKFDTYNSSTDYASGKIMGGYQWGAGLEVLPRENFGVELLYYRQDTKAPVNYYNLSAVTKTLDLSVNYILLGVNRYMRRDKLEPYGGFMVGAAVFNNKNPTSTETSSVTKFAVGFKLGVNIWVSEKVALKLQTQLLSAVQGFGGSLYFGTGGAGAGVGTYSTVTQFCLGGGLVFKLGQ